MLEMTIFLIILSGIISFFIRLCTFNSLYKNQKEAYEKYNDLKDNISLIELNSYFGKKGIRVPSFNSFKKYRWFFGDSIVVKDENNLIVPFSQFSNDLENRYKYTLKKSVAYIEMDVLNGRSIRGSVVGLN